MTSFWKISADKRGRLWPEFRDQKKVMLGWVELGDLNALSSEEAIRARFGELYPGGRPDQVLEFYFEFEAKDRVLVYGASQIFALATISGPYQFVQEAEFNHAYPVTWDTIFEPPIEVASLPDAIRLKLQRTRTIIQLTEEEWATIEEWASQGPSTQADAGADDDEAPSRGGTLSLERDLENFLEVQVQALEPGLTVEARQLDTAEAGRIDLLAKDRAGNFVVIELKAGVADERALAQLLRYIGWTKRVHAKGKSVRGILVASDFDSNLRWGIEAVQGVELKRYEVSFKFTAEKTRSE